MARKKSVQQPDKIKNNDPKIALDSEHQRCFNALIEEAKIKGFLIHEDLINLLSNDTVNPSQMESIVSRLNEMGIKVFEVAPDPDSLLLKANEESDDETNDDVAEVLATETRTIDPVRLYMREMSRVPLLTREGEVVIAKRIEEGFRQVLGAIIQYPELVTQFIQEYEDIAANEGRLNDIITGFFDLEEKAVTPQNKQATATESNQDKEEAGGNGSSSDDENELGNSGLDPEIAKAYIKELNKLLNR